MRDNPGYWIEEILNELKKIKPDSPMIPSLEIELDLYLPFTATYWYYHNEHDWYERYATLEDAIAAFYDFEDMFPGTITNQLTGEKWTYGLEGLHHGKGYLWDRDLGE